MSAMINLMALVPAERQRAIDSAISQIRLDTGMSYPKDGLLDIARELGLDVQVTELPDFESKGISAVIEWLDKEESEKVGAQARIYLNAKHPPERRTFSLAHEIGHYMLHEHTTKYRIDSFDYSKNTQVSVEETEANYFAARFLVPREELAKIWKITQDFEAIAKHFGVSSPVIENRLKWLTRKTY